MNAFRRTRPSILAIFAVSTAAVALLFGAKPAAATDNCIQDVWKAHGNTQNLTCTANDVRLAAVTNICTTAPDGSQCCEADGCQPTCIEGPTPFTFTADFEVLLTAQARYDIGLYLGTDGDPNGDGALTGQCTDNIILPGEEATGSTFVNLDNPGNLDQSGDKCGASIV